MGSCTVFSGNAKSHHMSWPLCKSRVFPIIMCMCSRLHNFFNPCTMWPKNSGWLNNFAKYKQIFQLIAITIIFVLQQKLMIDNKTVRSGISMFYICSLLSNTVNNESIFSNHYFWMETIYRISSYSFLGYYSFLNLEIQRSQTPETIQGRKQFKDGNYMRKYGT